MKKRVVIILVAILAVLLAAIVVIEIVKPKDNTPDTIIVNSNGEKGVLVDLETGSTVEGSSESKVTSTDDILGNEIVNDGDSADSSNTSDPNKQSMEGFEPWR
jgi:capsular polysaccharide biosynthesis protein